MDLRNIRLYGITSDITGSSLSLEAAARAAVTGGAGMLQLREKNISEEEYVRKAKSLLKVTRELGIPLIINDSVNAALRSGADGVHLGQSDGSPEKAREILGGNAIIGVTAKTVEQAMSAERAGADYLGCGAVFGSRTKENAVPMTMEALREICMAVNIPVFAIGGITAENAELLKGSGICGVAVVSAIFGKSSLDEISLSAKELYKKALEITAT